MNENIILDDYKFVTEEFGKRRSFEKIVEGCINDLKIFNDVWLMSKNRKYYQVYFTTNSHDTDTTIHYLLSKGIGADKNTSVGYFPFGLFYCKQNDQDNIEKIFAKREDSIKNFLNSITSRLSVFEVLEEIRNSASITFDFILYTLIAGCIACAGLMNNSPVDIASAMMIEPVMATVIAMSFGAVIHDRSLLKMGFRNCFISLIMCLFIGFIYGGIAMIWAKAWNPPAINDFPSGVWPTHEMQRHGLWRTLWYGALQALAAGGALSVTLLNNNQAALVGVAVCSTHLPPFINAGALWAYAVHLETLGLKQHWTSAVDEHTGVTYKMKPSWVPMHHYNYVYYFDMRYESLALGGVSMLLTLVDVICLALAAFAVLKLKEIVPLTKLEANRKLHEEEFACYSRRSTTCTTL
ncbi:hypothetical protein B4U80_10648 [Leptotrombidium deliense]|uniref:Uncharacterized protein n=1 Tax=Leptotrombidium deliense TaxID=299467 RepID=A0A443S850_9ACAR|nr:hypothetical protein B4U80_10648 [Leptotrombidium deliense]